MPRKIVLPRTCRECGRAFPGGPRAWYCPVCRAERRRVTGRNYKARRRKGLVRQLGSVDRCAVCGRNYVVSGPNQRYCPDCAACAVKEVDAEQGLEYYRAHADAINPPRKLARRKGPRPCVVCGEMFDTPTHRVTCGKPECKAEMKRIHQRTADAKRRAEQAPRAEITRLR